jgi:hypothetical protein
LTAAERRSNCSHQIIDFTVSDSTHIQDNLILHDTRDNRRV